MQETRKKQSALWQQLILSYCRHHKVRTAVCASKAAKPPKHRQELLFNELALQVYKVSTTATEELPIFSNLKINSKVLLQDGAHQSTCFSSHTVMQQSLQGG